MVTYHNITRKKLIGVAKPAEIDEVFAFSNSIVWRSSKCINDMKKLFPNVTFYSPDVVPNIESVLGEKTQLRFFPNQNARSCAEKMAEKLQNEK